MPVQGIGRLAMPINPARAYALLPIGGESGSDRGHAAVPILAPLIGAVAAGLFVHAIGI